MNPLEYRRSIQMAHDFLTRSFAPDEFIALLLRREKPVEVTRCGGRIPTQMTNTFWVGANLLINTQTGETTSVFQFVFSRRNSKYRSSPAVACRNKRPPHRD